MASCGNQSDGAGGESSPRLELGGPWHFYTQFYPAHGYCHLPVAKVPEIGIEPGATLVVPLIVQHDPSRPLAITVNVKAPDGWEIADGAGQIALPAEASTVLLVHVDTPKLAGDELKKATSQEVHVSAQADGKPVGEVQLRVLLRTGALPQ